MFFLTWTVALAVWNYANVRKMDRRAAHRRAARRVTASRRSYVIVNYSIKEAHGAFAH